MCYILELTHLWHYNNALFNSLLLYRSYYCSEIHALSYPSDDKYRNKP